MTKKYILYHLRWQGSTPILAGVMAFLALSNVAEAIIANFIGASIFFFY